MALIARTYSFAISAMFLGLFMQCAEAAIVVQGTRVVFPADVDDVTVRLSNSSGDPVLVQSWIDDGHADMAPEDVQVPFVVAPAVARVDPAQGLALRLTRTQPIPAADRESLFWLNVLEMPPRRASDESVLQFAFRTRIKLFYRPTSLSSSADVAAQKLEWKLVDASKGVAASSLEVLNPTPYYVSFGRVEVDHNGHSIPVKTGMVAPFASTVLAISTKVTGPTVALKVRYEAINDYGGRRMYERPVSQ